MRISNEELIGKRFGRLVIAYQTEDHVTPSGGHQAKFHCKCDCGGECDVLKYALTSGRQVSCGCVHRERTKELWKDEEFRERHANSCRTEEMRKQAKECLEARRHTPEFIEKHLAGCRSKGNRERAREAGQRNADNLSRIATKHGVWSRHPKLARTIMNHWKMCYVESNPSYRLYGAKGWVFAEEWLLSDGRPNFEAIEKWALDNGWKEDDGRVFEKDYLANMLKVKEISPRTVRFVTHRENCQRECRYVDDNI